MRRRHVLAAFAAALIMAPQLVFADVVDKVVGQLRAQGYTSIEVSRTWLGRTQIEAERPGEEREIILNRQTGEILRDYWRRTIGEDGDDENEEHELLDPDDDDDNSRSNSGPSGGGNSGSGGDDDDDGDGGDEDD